MSVSKCATSPRCKQPPAFLVVIGSWPMSVCEKHLGLLASRLLSSGNASDALRVTRLPEVTE